MIATAIPIRTSPARSYITVVDADLGISRNCMPPVCEKTPYGNVRLGRALFERAAVEAYGNNNFTNLTRH